MTTNYVDVLILKAFLSFISIHYQLVFCRGSNENCVIFSARSYVPIKSLLMLELEEIVIQGFDLHVQTLSCYEVTIGFYRTLCKRDEMMPDVSSWGVH
ncbi:hypothetical protein AQUCO_07800015v1 [Aquilegia coerulea]|uniref:Uncharacterized protein n=1 Tax=Aquilegia coerulea TaxID=218851 RepID=A0A2G5C7V7_AQUCA|nr:hypothetical protein AQUCO_07800015v1 [Aquilegia coerulea]